MKEKQFDYYINVGYAKDNSLSDIHVYEGDKVIFKDDDKTNKVRLYQYNTRIFVGLITQEELNKYINV
jgi:hypothetical protein